MSPMLALCSSSRDESPKEEDLQFIGSFCVETALRAHVLRVSRMDLGAGLA